VFRCRREAPLCSMARQGPRAFAVPHPHPRVAESRSPSPASRVRTSQPPGPHPQVPTLSSRTPRSPEAPLIHPRYYFGPSAPCPQRRRAVWLAGSLGPRTREAVAPKGLAQRTRRGGNVPVGLGHGPFPASQGAGGVALWLGSQPSSSFGNVFCDTLLDWGRQRADRRLGGPMPYSKPESL
jgi:hypothetical protein